MNKPQKQIVDIVHDYKVMFGKEYDEVVMYIIAKREEMKSDTGVLKDGDFKSEYIDRKIFEVPETLHTMLKEKLTAEEYAYYTTKAGSRWFAKRFGEFCLVNI